MPEEVKKEEIKKPKGPFGKLKEKVEDSEEHLAILSTFVRLGILVWSGGILTLNYVTIPNLPQQKIDPTFIASVFTGVLATFGVQTAKKSGDGTMKMNGNGNGAAAAGAGGGITKADLERLIAAASQTAPAQTIRVEQGPIKIVTDQPPYKM
jgi:hypothetical protein|tara:strand:+ start:99 stop:554 length:456 start_codon:yes stop_codon:yes gene_type:complete